jgi:O-antigen/teichoic acid export membrane protein
VTAPAEAAVSRQIGAVAVGLAVLGVASFAFISLSGRALGPDVFAPLGTLWVLINAAGPALFQPLEQELGRGISHARELGTGARPLFVRGAALAAVTLLAAGVFLALAQGPLADQVFQGRSMLVLALFVGLAGLAAEHVTRGAFAGAGAFGRYGWQLGMDGAFRLGGAVLLIVVGVGTVGPYALVLAGAPVIAVALTAARLGPALQPGPPETTRRVAGALGLLTAGSVLSQVVVNAPAVIANVLAGPAEQARAGVFISVLVLTRVPLFLFAAIQAAFLPGLAALAARDARRDFVRRVGTIVGLVSALGLAGLLVVLAVGPWLVELVYGPDYQSTRSDLWPLAAGAGLFMIGSALAQTLISLRAYAASVAGWLAGTVALALGLTLHLRLEQRVGLAFFLGTAVAVVVLGALLLRRVRAPLNPPVVARETEE